MDRLQSHIDINSQEFRANRERMQALVDEHRGRLERVRQGGGPKYLARHREQGKMPVRERIEALIDPGSALLELSHGRLEREEFVAPHELVPRYLRESDAAINWELARPASRTPA